MIFCTKNGHSIAVVSAFMILSCQREKPMESTVSFEEELLGTIPSEVNIVSDDDVVFSPDGKKIAFGARDGNRLVWKVVDVK